MLFTPINVIYSNLVIFYILLLFYLLIIKIEYIIIKIKSKFQKAVCPYYYNNKLNYNDKLKL